MKQPSLSAIEYGKYTPTVTNVTNGTSLSGSEVSFTRIGNIVRCGLRIAVTPSILARTTVNVSLPIPTNFSSAITQGVGQAVCIASSTDANVNSFARLYPDTTNEQMSIDFIAKSTASNIIYGSFEYEIA